MLDKVVVLNLKAAGAYVAQALSKGQPAAGAYVSQAPPKGQPAAGANGLQALSKEQQPLSSRVAVRVSASAPEGRCELKLWDEHGRKPVALDPPLVFRKPDDPRQDTWSVEEKGLDGRTLTWSARLCAPRAADRFTLDVQVLLDGDPVQDGSFHYSGPLEASEIEERTGRFHFKVPEPPKGQIGSAV